MGIVIFLLDRPMAVSDSDIEEEEAVAETVETVESVESVESVEIGVNMENKNNPAASVNLETIVEGMRVYVY